MFEFQWPYLFLLLPLPWLVYQLMPKAAQIKQAIVTPFFWQYKKAQASGGQHSHDYLNLLLLSLAWLALLSAAAKPVWLGDLVQLPKQSKNVILAIDLSSSMQAQDFKLNGRTVNRLNVVKAAAEQFIKQRKNDRIGLIVFGTQAYLYAPLTFDTKLVQQFLRESRIGMAGEKTAIGDSIAMAIKHFRALKIDNKQDKILILLTDGANTAGTISPSKAIEMAQLEHLKIYTIGLGSDSAGFGFFRRASIDEAALKKIASATGGQYFRAKNTKALAQIYQALDQLESVTVEQPPFRPEKDLFFYPLSVFLLLSSLLAIKRLLL